MANNVAASFVSKARKTLSASKVVMAEINTEKYLIKITLVSLNLEPFVDAKTYILIVTVQADHSIYLNKFL